MEAFADAFTAAGGTVSRHVRIFAPAQGERGVFVSESLTDAELATDALVIIPASLVITAAVAGRSNIVARCCAQLNTDTASDAVQMALFLFTEQAQGAASPWKWYLDALPRTGINALSFGERDMHALDHTPLGLAVKAKLKQLQRQYDCFASTLERWKQDVGANGSVSFEMYKWAHAIVLSRTISLRSFAESGGSSNSPSPHGDCDEALLPFLDMFNHSSQPSAFWTISSDGSVRVCADMRPSGPHMCEAGQNLAELHFSYGDKPNTEWLYDYGFMPPDNSHDAWPYFVEPQGSPELVEIKQMWLQELGLSPR
ncbi:hypothetical protein GGF43_006294, partial [Coemansia sp. RSA 2618]